MGLGNCTKSVVVATPLTTIRPQPAYLAAMSTLSWGTISLFPKWFNRSMTQPSYRRSMITTDRNSSSAQHCFPHCKYHFFLRSCIASTIAELSHSAPQLNPAGNLKMLCNSFSEQEEICLKLYEIPAWRRSCREWSHRRVSIINTAGKKALWLACIREAPSLYKSTSTGKAEEENHIPLGKEHTWYSSVPWRVEVPFQHSG